MTGKVSLENLSEIFWQKTVFEKEHLKLTSHDILHYLGSADLSKSFSQLILSVYLLFPVNS